MFILILHQETEIHNTKTNLENCIKKYTLLKWKEGNGGLRVETTLSKEFFYKGKNRAIAGGRSGVIKYLGYF